MKQFKKLVVVSGLAGAGKTVAIHALEDLGYYCIDNLPSVLLKSFVQSLENGQLKHPHLALALDSRDVEMSMAFQAIYSKLEKICQVQVLFLEASNEVLLKRFHETRRQHPLSQTAPLLSLAKVIQLDIDTLSPLRKLAYLTLNTSHMLPAQLKRTIKDYFAIAHQEQVLLHLVSFGFKFGVPADLNTVFDVRCFKNPHYNKDLRELTGLDPKVKEYVLSDTNVAVFLDKIINLIQFLYPLYKDEGKHYFSIGIGCTGGKHRSVVIVEELAQKFKETVPLVNVEHRHLDKK